MKSIQTYLGLLLLAVLAGGVWILRFHPEWLSRSLEEEGEAEVEALVSVRTGKVITTTLHRYIQAVGTVEPQPPRAGSTAGSATVASPVAGVVAEVLCEAGQKVAKGDALIQLDDRLARAAERQAAAAVESAKAALAVLKATPRPEQLEASRLAVEKAQSTLGFATKNLERQQELAKREGTSQKSLEQAEVDVASARNDVKAAEAQLALLKATPAPEELVEAAAKVTEAEAALVTAQTQRSLLRIVAPLDATVARIAVNPGESVETTTPVATLVALDRLVVMSPVPAAEAISLKIGLPAKIYAAEGAKAEPACEGKVYFVGADVQRATNSVTVGIEVPAGVALRPGQTVRLSIVVEEHRSCLAVPKEAVVKGEEGEDVVCLVEGETATQVPVKVGFRDGDLVEVSSDEDELEDGQDVVTAGAYGLPDETKVKIITDEPKTEKAADAPAEKP
jgi:multidrug efflux pump subunit AcrA (membrane-fusion protein)